MKKQAPKAKIAFQALGSKGSGLVFVDDALRKQAIATAKTSGNGKFSGGGVLADIKNLFGKGEESSSTKASSSDMVLIDSDAGPAVTFSATGAGDSFSGGFLMAL
ncbi:MAG: hypothetical protein SGARI_007622, partial [Bacillariaceae sp.]